MGAERYLNHPTFGMLYQVAPIGDGKDVYATLYAQKMFFIVSSNSNEVQFEVIPLQDARNYSEAHLSKLRRNGSPDLEQWKELFHQTFI